MVTRVYNNSYMPNIIRPRKESEQKLSADAGKQEFNSEHPSQGLATVTEEAEHHKIHLNTILHDFKSTMDALGADESIRGEVDAYLNVVSLQAEKSSPSVPFIRQTLKTAADSLDGFIAQALEQPSRVVRDWVEALLLQKIEYREATEPILTQLDRPWASEATKSNQFDLISANESTLAPSTALTPEEKQAFKAQVQQGKAWIAKGHILQEAMPIFKKALDSIEDRNQPALEGRLLALMGRSMRKANKKEEAMDYLKQAEIRFGEAGQTEKQISLRYKLGNYHDEQGDLESAQFYYEGVLALKKEHGLNTGMDHILNDLGVLYLRQGDSPQAFSMLNEAAQVASLETTATAGQLLPDIYSNMGALHRLDKNYKASAQAYHQSLKMAQAFKDKPSYTRTLESLADLYQENGQLKKAQDIQQRLARLA